MNQSIDTIKYLTPSELSSLLTHVRSKSIRDYAIIQTAVSHALRISEVGKLQLSDFDADNRRIKIRRVKNGPIGIQYLLSDDTLKALKNWVSIRGKATGPLFASRRSKLGQGKETPEQGITKRTLHTVFKDYAIAAKLPEDKQHFHVLRHTCAVNMVDKEIPMRNIADWMGHRNINSTMVYARVSDMARNATAEKFYGEQKEREPVRAKRKTMIEKVQWKKDKK